MKQKEKLMTDATPGRIVLYTLSEADAGPCVRLR